MTRRTRPVTTAARACYGKLRHLNRSAAVSHMTRLIGIGASPAGLVVYECRARRCGEQRHWHVGHRPGLTRRR